MITSTLCRAQLVPGLVTVDRQTILTSINQSTTNF